MEGWKPQVKMENELKEQISQTEKILGTELVPQDTEDKFLKLSIEEIKNKYPERYKAYLKILRVEKNKQEIDNEELSQMKDWIKILNNLDLYILTHNNNSNESSVRLKDRQFTVFEDIRNSLEQGQKEGYIKLPTGVGKTILFLEFIKAIDSKTLIVVPTKQLVEQTEQKIEKFAPDLKYGKVYTHEKNFKENTTIITYDSFVSNVESKKIKPEDYKVVILDEVHRGLSLPRRNTLSKFEDTIKIGFTATPKYSEEKQVNKVLKNEIHSLDVKEATEEGLLSSFSCVIAQTDIDLSSVEINSSGEYITEQLEKAINIESRNKAVAMLYEQGFKDKSAIVFCSTIKHADGVAKEFTDKGISATVISGKTHKTERERIIEDYKSEKIKVLLSVDLLIEGFDAQNASVCFNLAPTHSYVRGEQRAGRVLRIDENNPYKHSYIIDFIDNDIRKDKSPILFSEIVGVSSVYPNIKFEESNIKKDLQEREEKIFPKFNIDGLKITIDSKEVLKITQSLSEDREKIKWDYDSLQKDVISKDVKSSGEYIDIASKYKWPYVESLKRMPEFKSWDNFLGREERPSWNYNSLREDVISKGVKSSLEYQNNYSKYNWPGVNTLRKMPEFKDWDEFLGREKFDFNKLQEDVKSKNIKTGVEYINNSSKYNWPSQQTLRIMPEFKSWDEFLGREKKPNWAYSSLKENVNSKNIQTSSQYQKYSPENNWPSITTLTKMPEFESWDEFLGRRRKRKWNYFSVIDEVRSQGIKSSYEYQNNASKYNWPSRQKLEKMPEFKSWDEFLGREKK